MNSLKISYDGRVTFWNAGLQSIQRPKDSTRERSPEWGLFSKLCPEGKKRFLLSGLGLSHVTNSDSSQEAPEKARRGTKGITSYGRSVVRMGAQALEDRHGLKNLTFLTATLPESALIVCTPQTWALVVNRFLKSLGFHLRKQKLSSELVGCTEIQESRLLRSGGVPPLHLHLLFQGRETGKTWVFPPVFFRDVWERACLSVWGGSHQFQASCRVESLRVSGVSYLGKYMSKGGDVLTSVIPTLLPSSWYTITTKLKNFVKRSEFRASGTYVCDLFHWLKDHDFLMWTKEVWSEMTRDGSYFLMAWVGAIRGRSKYWEIVEASRLFCSRRYEGDPVRFSELFPESC